MSSDDRPAEIRHIHVETTPRDRRFVVWFIAIWVAACGALIALGVIVDPLASYGTGIITPLVPNDRDQKAAAYERMSPRPEAIIIGSSRVMKLPPSCVEQSTGLRAYNFGLNSARAEDYLAVLAFAQQLGPVRRIVLGLDPEALHNSVDADDRLLKSTKFAAYVDPSLRPSRAITLVRGTADALSWETFMGSLRALKYELRGGRPALAYDFDSTGQIHYFDRERQVKAGTYNQAPAVEASITEYANRYRTFTALSAERTARLEEFLRRARAQKVRVDAFIPPLHPTVVAGLAQSSVAARTRETESLLIDLERRGLLHFARLGTLESFGGDPAMYFDGAHMMEGNAVRLIAAIFGTPVCAVQ